MIDESAPDGDPPSGACSEDEPSAEPDARRGAGDRHGDVPKKLPPLHLHRVVIHLPNSPLLKERRAVKRQAAPALETPTLSTPAPLGKVILQPAQPKTRAPRSRPTSG